MRSFHLSIGIVLFLVCGTAEAFAAEWRKFVIPTTGASADIPVSIFEGTELPDGGIGRRFFTDDRRADLTIQSVPNPRNDSPATFLAKRNPAARHLIQEGNAGLFRGVERPQGSDLVQSLQSGKRLYELHSDQLSSRRENPVGRHRHSNKTHTGKVTAAHFAKKWRKSAP